MRIIVFASGGGGNLHAAIRLSIEKPNLIQVGLVITDRPEIPAISIAKEFSIPVFTYNFEKECGIWSECQKDAMKAKLYKHKAKEFHNRVLKDIISFEQKNNTKFDLTVLSYHRWIHGNLLDYFNERMINQHSGDLSVMSEDNPTTRKYIGINPVLMALLDGVKKTRTSTFLVRNSHDGGEILCQGPWVSYKGPYPVTKKSAWKHELIQKKESDWPSLTFALCSIAMGKYGLTSRSHNDGSKILTHDNTMLPYGGVDLSF